MTASRLALANVRIPNAPEESVTLATEAIAEAGGAGARVLCFPERYIPGDRWPGTSPPAPDTAFLERAWTVVAAAAREAQVAVILGTERVTASGLQIAPCVCTPDRSVAAGPLTFGVVICHEGWRYPETVRWAVRRGAQVVFHPHAHVAGPDGSLLDGPAGVTMPDVTAVSARPQDHSGMLRRSLMAAVRAAPWR